MSHIRSHLFLKSLAALFCLLAILMTFLSFQVLFQPIEHSFCLMILGGAILFLSFIGPTRILFLKIKMPNQIKQTITIIGISLPLIGLCFLITGSFPYHLVKPVFFVIISILFLIIALFSFLQLAQRLPKDLYLDEMLSVIKDAHFLDGKGKNIVEETYKKWTSGTDGLFIDSRAPNGDIFTLQGKSLQLLGYLNQEDPDAYWVLNFGSYTCPQHRKRIDELHVLMSTWAPKGVRFLTIYIAEAHPEDEWRLDKQYIYDKEYTGNPKDFKFYQPKLMSERLKMAQWLIDKKQFQMTIVLDNMQNTLLKQYNTWPIRLYVIKDSRIVYTGEQGPFGYSPSNLSRHLQYLLNSD